MAQPAAPAVQSSQVTAALAAIVADPSDPVAVSTNLEIAAGAPVALVINIASPPVPVVALVGDITATAPSADAAVLALGQVAVTDGTPDPVAIAEPPQVVST